MSGRPSISGFLRENENEELIQRVMSQERVSIQVARNLLKAGKLGVGPGAKYLKGGATLPPDQQPVRDSRSSGGPGAGPPPKFDKKSVAKAMEEKLRRMQEEKEDLEDEEIERKRKALQAQKKKTFSIGRLGPVASRDEEVDPLKSKIAAMEDKAKAEEEEVEYALPNFAKPVVTQDELRKLNKEHRRKKRHREEDSEDSDEPAHHQKPPERPAASSSGSGSLMSEAEAKASLMKGRDKHDRKVQRGSAGAAARIQREMAEWEQSKAKNPEFWKPPKFCLVLGSGRR